MRPRRILSGILLPAYLSSCASWQVSPVSPEQAITEEQPSKIQLTLTDGSTVAMHQPVMVGDTVRGIIEGPPARDAPRGTKYTLVERDIPLADIATLRVAKTDVAKSILFPSAWIAGALVVAVALGACAMYC
jgi:hypothetical protein